MTMIGVVLWSDPAGKAAVFWCEDHGDLAYFERSDEMTVGGSLFVAGDMVEFEATYDGKLRKASNAWLVQEQACEGLPERLRQTAQALPPVQAAPAEAEPRRCANIIAFGNHRKVLQHQDLPNKREA